MLYDGKKASLLIQNELKERLSQLSANPKLAVLSIATHPSITSFITIKRKFGEVLGITVDEYDFPLTYKEENLIEEIQKIAKSNDYTGMIVQLPLPEGFNTRLVLDHIPQELDVDVLGRNAFAIFEKEKRPIPPVACAIAHILEKTEVSLLNKKVVIVGYGILVGEPVFVWFKHQGIESAIIDITTDEAMRTKLFKEADIVVSGIGKAHYLKKEYFKKGVILIDAGTSKENDILAGDFDPSCEEIAYSMTPVPGGVGPLTVAFLFKNLITFAESNNK